jgi:hypothetical protein
VGYWNLTNVVSLFFTDRKGDKGKPQKSKSAAGGGFLKPSSKDTPRRGSNV